MNVPVKENEEILKLLCAIKAQEPYKHTFLEDHLFSLDKVPHTSSGHNVFLSQVLLAAFN